LAEPGVTKPWLYRYSVPFQVPAGHWIRYAAPSASFPLTVLTLPEPPHVGAAEAVPAVLAVNPPTARPAVSAIPANLFKPTMKPLAPQAPSFGRKVTYRQAAPAGT
jgi:hypothetical protein